MEHQVQQEEAPAAPFFLKAFTKQARSKEGNRKWINGRIGNRS